MKILVPHDEVTQIIADVMVKRKLQIDPSTAKHVSHVEGEYDDAREVFDGISFELTEPEAVNLVNRHAWKACCRASNRLADLVCAMYHPKDEQARKTWPTATWAELIASELDIETPSAQEGRDNAEVS